MSQRTFAIIKPDAVARGLSGRILAIAEEAGFRVVGMKKIQMSRKQAEGFYAVHRERPFFAGLVEFMTEGPCVVMVLEKDNAIAAWRELMGATNPEKAAEGTIRKMFGENVERNCCHGSDAVETAAAEIPYFFSAIELT